MSTRRIWCHTGCHEVHRNVDDWLLALSHKIPMQMPMGERLRTVTESLHEAQVPQVIPVMTADAVGCPKKKCFRATSHVRALLTRLERKAARIRLRCRRTDSGSWPLVQWGINSKLPR